MATRLIIVSNRVAMPDTRAAPRGRAGGRGQGRAARSRRRLVRLERRHQRRRSDGAAPPQTRPGRLRRHRPLRGRLPGILQRLRQPGAVADPALPGRPAGIFARRPKRLHARQQPVRRPARRDHRGRRRRLGARLSSDAARPRTQGARPRQPDRLLPPHSLRAARHPGDDAQPRGDPRQPRPLRPGRLPDRQRSRQLRPLSDVAGREAGAQRKLHARRPARPVSAPFRSASKPPSTPASPATRCARASCARWSKASTARS